MLTIFTVPKPFRGHIGIIQNNAIRSWTRLYPECEVILIGNEEGTAEIASKLGTQHIPDVECNEYGTPLVTSVFSIAQDIASHQLMCYVNADIILTSDILTAIRQIQVHSFLLIGQRWDIDLKEPIDFSTPTWEEQLRSRLAKAGKLHGQSGLDYFVFPRGMYRDIPLFVIGRGAWDNWLVYQARSLKVPVIDATKAITVIHQSHDYSHHPGGAEGVWEGPEAIRNRQLTGWGRYAFTLDHATWILTLQGLRRALTPRRFYFRMRAIPILYPRLHFLITPFRVLEKSLRTVRLIRARLRPYRGRHL